MAEKYAIIDKNEYKDAKSSMLIPPSSLDVS